jgi:DNA-directed RNA polymerase specialized sigma subunit
MKAKEFLEQVKKINTLIENKLAEVAQWKAIATSATAGGTDVTINGKVHQMDKVQSSGSQQKMADAVIHYVDLEAEINADIDKLIDTKKDVLKVIEQLEAEKYDLLHKVYVQGFTLDEVALKYGFSYSWATTLHGRALKDVQIILDERGEQSDR